MLAGLAALGAGSVAFGLAPDLGWVFAGGLGLVTKSAPAHHRAAVMSTAYVVGYLLQALAAPRGI
jgi:hypothetical protein